MAGVLVWYSGFIVAALAWPEHDHAFHAARALGVSVVTFAASWAVKTKLQAIKISFNVANSILGDQPWVRRRSDVVYPASTLPTAVQRGPSDSVSGSVIGIGSDSTVAGEVNGDSRNLIRAGKGAGSSRFSARLKKFLQRLFLMHVIMMVIGLLHVGAVVAHIRHHLTDHDPVRFHVLIVVLASLGMQALMSMSLVIYREEKKRARRESIPTISQTFSVNKGPLDADPDPDPHQPGPGEETRSNNSNADIVPS